MVPGRRNTTRDTVEPRICDVQVLDVVLVVVGLVILVGGG